MFVIQDTKTGIVFDTCPTMDKAVETVNLYEMQDKDDNDYVQGRYTIKEE